MSDKTLEDLKVDAHIAVLHTKVDSLIDKQKELTERVRANEKVVAAVTLLGTVVIAVIGAGYFAPKAEACSPFQNGSSTYCVPDPLPDVKCKGDFCLPPNLVISRLLIKDDPMPQYYEEHNKTITLIDTRDENSNLIAAWNAGQMIQDMREWKSEQTRTPVDESINNSLVDYQEEIKPNGCYDSPEQEELLQLQSNGDSKGS